MFEVPIQVIASWLPWRSENPDTRGPAQFVISALFLFVATGCLALRLYSRTCMRKFFAVDDVLVILAYVFSVCLTVLAALGQTKYQWNRHLWDVDINIITPAVKILYFARLCLGLSTSFVRLSVICLLYRLANSCQAPRLYYRILHGTTAFNILLLIYFVISGALPCFPVRAYWVYPSIPGSHCLDDGLSMSIGAVFNTLAEFWLAALPTVAVYKLNVDRRQRLQVLFILSLGYIIGIAGIIRIGFVFKCFSSYDYTWWSSPQWICATVEIDLAIICACVPAIRPLLGNMRKRSKFNKPLPVSEKSGTKKTSPDTMNYTMNSTDSGINEWNTLMTRNVDIEGLVTEGFGYTINITGPPKVPRSQRAMNILRGVYIGRASRNENRAEDSRLGVARRTSIVVESSQYKAAPVANIFTERAPSESDFDHLEFLSGNEGLQTPSRASSTDGATQLNRQNRIDDDKLDNINSEETQQAQFFPSTNP